MKDYQRFAIGAFVIIAAALITFGVYNRFTKRVSQEEIIPLPTPESGFPTAEISPPPIQPESGTNTNLNTGIRITEPQDGTFVTSPLKVKGLANVDGGVVTVKVIDLAGKVLGRSNVFGCMGEDFCPFEATINFTKPQTSTGFVEAESASTDNLPQFLQRLTIFF